MFLLQVLNINWFQKHQDGHDGVGIIYDCFVQDLNSEFSPCNKKYSLGCTWMDILSFGSSWNRL